jgi:hypothetical protein
MPFDGSARSFEPSRPGRTPPPVKTWTPRAFSAPLTHPAVELGRFLVGLGAGLVLIGTVALVLMQF